MDKRGDDHYHGSRNHGWLCGGLAEWLYSVLGGISPGADGFGTVIVAPQISHTASLGPDSVAMELRTVRGVVRSNWTRSARIEARDRPWKNSDAAVKVNLALEVPPSTTALVNLPLLGGNKVVLLERGSRCVSGDQIHHLVWSKDAGATNSSINGVTVEGFGTTSASGRLGLGNADVLSLTVASGRYEFVSL